MQAARVTPAPGAKLANGSVAGPAESTNPLPEVHPSKTVARTTGEASSSNLGSAATVEAPQAQNQEGILGTAAEAALEHASTTNGGTVTA